MWGDEKYYLQKVDSTLEKLRSYCLGQNTRLLAILPNHFLTHTSEQQSRQIAKQILFAMAKTMSEDISTEELNRSSAWLQTVTQYLLEECNDTDQTFQEMKRLIFLPQHIRQIVFCDVSGLVGKDIRENEPPGLLKELDGSFWWLLKVQGLTDAPEKAYRDVVCAYQKFLT